MDYHNLKLVFSKANCGFWFDTEITDFIPLRPHVSSHFGILLKYLFGIKHYLDSLIRGKEKVHVFDQLLQLEANVYRMRITKKAILV